ncbi:hypothetical protein D3C87_2184440 [compost metagenome]
MPLSAEVTNRMKSIASGMFFEAALIMYPSGAPSMDLTSPLASAGAGSLKKPKSSRFSAPSAVAWSNSMISW